jgi:hypothetical protein
MNDAETDYILEMFRDITETESVDYIWKDGEYQGCVVTYANLAPPFRTMFHPYIPLMITRVSAPGEPITAEPWPRLTRDYFLQRGLSVPGEIVALH